MEGQKAFQTSSVSAGLRAEMGFILIKQLGYLITSLRLLMLLFISSMNSIPSVLYVNVTHFMGVQEGKYHMNSIIITPCFLHLIKPVALELY